MTLIKKKIFVTVGTTKFDELIKTVLSSEVLEVKKYKFLKNLIIIISLKIFKHYFKEMF